MAHLVRSLRTYARNRSLTTGTFNLIVKDRIALRLSGTHSVRRILAWRAKATPCANPSVLETHQPYWRRKPLSTAASHRISTRFPHREIPGEAASRASQARNSMGLPLDRLKFEGAHERTFSRHAKAEDRKLIKELALEVLTLKVPFRNLLLPVPE